MTRVLISVPTEGWIHKHVCMATDRLLADQRYEKLLIRPTHRPFENNLHMIRRQMLREGWDYWLSIDSDNPPMNNPLDLVSLDKDIIGCPTPVWHWDGTPGDRPIYFNAYAKKPGTDGYTEYRPQEGLQEVDAIGTGCFIVARRVMDALDTGAFRRTHHRDGVVHKGNDIAFCERARKKGFKVFAHFDYPCMHFHELELTEVIRAFKGLGVQ